MPSQHGKTEHVRRKSQFSSIKYIALNFSEIYESRPSYNTCRTTAGMDVLPVPF